MIKLAKYLLITLLIACACAAIGEIGCRVLGLTPKSNLRTEQLAFSIRPDDFYQTDSLLGWHLGMGVFNHYKNDTVFITQYHNNRSGRITSLANPETHKDSLKSIFLFGCSYTYGYSVADTANYPFYLQAKLPAYKIWNMGVPGYSFTQMYLSLINQVEYNGQHPQIAVFNYSSLHDMRTPLFYNWSVMVKQGLRITDQPENERVYPYGLIKNDTLCIQNYPWNDLVNDFPLRYKSALVNLINTAWFNTHDRQELATLQQVSTLTALKIIAYCKQHNIVAVFTGLDKEVKPVFDLLQDSKANTLLFSVDVTKDGYNNGPIDKGHPSPKAHSEYANELYAYLKAKNLVQDSL